MKTLIKVAVLLLLVLCGGAYYGWLQFQPTAAEFSAKDQEKYDLMIVEAKSFGFEAAQKLYDEIDAMTPKEVNDLRYRKWKEKLETDKEFRDTHLEEQLKLREQGSIERKSKHDLKLRALVSKPEAAKLRGANWNKSGPRQKVMVLREKCVKYLKMEEMDRRRRKNLLELSRISSILDRPEKMSCGKKTANICLAVALSEYCMDLVPNTSEDSIALEAVQRLKGKMNHFYYLRMLEDIGVSMEGLEFDQQLKGVSNFFTEF